MSTCRGDGVLLVATREGRREGVAPSGRRLRSLAPSDAINWGPLHGSGYGASIIILIIGRVVPLHM